MDFNVMLFGVWKTSFAEFISVQWTSHVYGHVKDITSIESIMQSWASQRRLYNVYACPVNISCLNDVLRI